MWEPITRAADHDELVSGYIHRFFLSYGTDPSSRAVASAPQCMSASTIDRPACGSSGELGVGWMLEGLVAQPNAGGGELLVLLIARRAAAREVAVAAQLVRDVDQEIRCGAAHVESRGPGQFRLVEANEAPSGAAASL